MEQELKPVNKPVLISRLTLSNFMTLISKFKISILCLLLNIYIPPVFSDSESQSDMHWVKTIGDYELAFENGDVEAAHWLGTFYYDGVGVGKNMVIAAGYLSVAANAGVVGSMFYLADMHLEGMGFKKDCEKAEKWLIKAYGGEYEEEGNDWGKKLCKCRNSKLKGTLCKIKGN